MAHPNACIQVSDLKSICKASGSACSKICDPAVLEFTFKGTGDTVMDISVSYILASEECVPWTKPQQSPWVSSATNQRHRPRVCFVPGTTSS